MNSENFVKRFFSKIDWSACAAGSTCWEWTGLRNPRTGRAHCGTNGRERVARRIFTLFKIPLRPDEMACHTCDNPGCVNPAHIYAGNAKSNYRDAINRGQLSILRGENHGRAKLSWDQVLEIREAQGKVTCRDLANKFGVSRQNISAIWRKESWNSKM